MVVPLESDAAEQRDSLGVADGCPVRDGVAESDCSGDPGRWVAEILVVYHLPASRNSATGERKRRRISELLGWAGAFAQASE